MSLLRRKKYVDTVKPDDVLVLGIHEEPEILGIASPIPYKNVKLVKIKDLVVTAQDCIHLNVADPSSFAGIYKNTTTVDGQCYVNLRRLKSLSLNLTIVENGDFIDIDTTAEANEGDNIGGGAELYQMMVGEFLTFRTLTSSDGSLTIVQNADTVDIIITGGNCCSLEDTLLIGQITGGLDIITSDGDSVSAATGDAVLNLRLAADTWFLGNLTSPTTTNSFLSGDLNHLFIGMDITAEFGLECRGTEVTLGAHDPASPPSFLSAVHDRVKIINESTLSSPQDIIDGVIVCVDSSGQDRNGSSQNEGRALFLNSGLNAQPTKFEAGFSRSVALGGKELTINTDDTAYANQISLQQPSNTFNTFIVPSFPLVTDQTAIIQDASGVLAYLSDISGGPSVFNIYNQDGQLLADRILDGNSKAWKLYFVDLDEFIVDFINKIKLSPDILEIGGITSVSIATPNTLAASGKIGQVLKLNTTIGGCDWEDKYFAVDLDSAESTVVRVAAGGRTTFTVTHSLDTLDIKPEIFRLSDGRTMGWRVERTGVNTVEASRTGNVANGLFRIII